MAVLRFAAIRLVSLVLVLWLVASGVFVLLRVIPGDPVRIIAGLNVVDPAVLARLHHQLGLDQPLLVQYGQWLGHVVEGNLGTSIRQQTPVAQLVAESLPVTGELALLALLVALAISVPLGVAAARRKGGLVDVLLTSGSLVGISLPSFVLALVAIYGFAIKLQVLPAVGYVSPRTDLGENLRLMIMPAITLGLISAGILMRMLRRSVIDQLAEDYTETARAKGASERRVVYGHALRNALIPYVTVAGIEAGVLLSGAVIVETIFAIPGMGQLVIQSINQRDYPVVQGAVFAIAALYVLVNLVVDVLYSWLDPRIALR